MTHYFRICSLLVESAFELPGAAPAAPGDADVSIGAGEVPEALGDAGERHTTFEIARARLLLRIPNVARFLLEDGRAVTIAPEPGASAADAVPFVLGTVFGLLLHQRGEVVLHASAVRVGDKAALFVGPSATGKSTLAAALAERGYPVLSDNLCRITIAGRVPLLHPDACSLSIWEDGIDRLGLAARRGPPVRAVIKKYRVATPACDGAALPLAAVYALRETKPPARDGVERPNVVDQTLVVRRHAFRPLLVRFYQQRARYLGAAAAIAQATGVDHFHLTRNFASLQGALDLLIAHWRERGLIGAAP